MDVVWAGRYRGPGLVECGSFRSIQDAQGRRHSHTLAYYRTTMSSFKQELRGEDLNFHAAVLLPSLCRLVVCNGLAFPSTLCLDSARIDIVRFD